MKTVISLCDLTGNMVKPWIDAGYSALLVDPQHPKQDGWEWIGRDQFIHRFSGTIEDAMDQIGAHIRSHDVAVVFGFPPCTDMAVSGARWFRAKYEADKLFQAKAVMVAEQCRTVGRLSGAPYMVENPVSPADYTAYEPADNYTKKTCLWTGNGFVMPQPAKDPSLGKPDNRIHFASPGPERANFRSTTPMGFARAVFDANHKPALEVAA